jgi:hypothetical protein
VTSCSKSNVNYLKWIEIKKIDWRKPGTCLSVIFYCFNWICITTSIDFTYKVQAEKSEDATAIHRFFSFLTVKAEQQKA